MAILATRSDDTVSEYLIIVMCSSIRKQAPNFVEPLGVRVNWDFILTAADYQFKVVKSLTPADIDTYAEVNALAGADVVIDWTADVTAAAVPLLRSNKAYSFAVIAKKGDTQIWYSPKTQMTPEAHFPNILGLPNGDLLVVYKDASDGNKGKTVIYDKNGGYKSGPSTVVSALDSAWDDYFDLIPLSGGGAAMGFLDNVDGNGMPNYIKLDATGAAVGSKQALSAWNKTYLGPELAETGGKLFAYYSADDKSPAVQGSRYSIYNVSDNTAVVNNALLSAGGNNVECRCVAVSAVGGAGRFFVIDSRDWSGLTPRYRIFNSDGTVAKAETAFATTKSETFSPILLGNGNVMVSYKDLNDSNKGKIAVYNDAGDVVIGATVFANTDVSSWRLPTTLTDAGDAFIGYSDYNDAHKAKYSIVQPDGTVLVSSTALDGGIAFPLGVANVATVNKLAIVYRHKDDTSYWLGFLNEPAD